MRDQGGNHLPYDPFFWQDYDSDPGLRACSLASQGLWMRMLCIMARGEKYGYLLDNGKQMESKTLAKLSGESVAAVEALKEELFSHGVYSTTPDGVIYCRRMARKETISEMRSLAGRMGGRPRKQNESKTKAKQKHRLNMNMNKEYSKILIQWNEFAEAHGLVKIVDIMKGSTREAAVRGRMAQPEFSFEGLLEMIGKSPFLLCQVPNKPFRATFDWVMKASNYQKIIEGNYLSMGEPPGLFSQKADHLGALKERK